MVKAGHTVRGARSKPGLVVPARASSQETVLSACKTLSGAGPVSVGLRGRHTYQAPNATFCELPQAS
jgi:hypothetical protein